MKALKNSIRRKLGHCKAAWIVTLKYFYSVDFMILSHQNPVSEYLRERRRPLPVFFILTMLFISGIFLLPEIADYTVEASYGDDSLLVSAFVNNIIVEYLLVIIPGIFAILGIVLQILHWRNFKLFRKYFEIETIGREYAGHS